MKTITYNKSGINETFKKSNGTIECTFTIEIAFNELTNHVSFFSLKRDNGILVQGRNKLQSEKFCILCEKLGYKIDLTFDSIEDEISCLK